LSNFINLIHNKFGTKIKIIRSDDGSEFICKDLYNNLRIIYQNKLHRNTTKKLYCEKETLILNVTRSLLFHSKIHENFWSFVVIHFVHLINKIPYVVIRRKSPYELVYKELPDLCNLRFFDSFCFVSSIERNRSKLDPRDKKWVFLRCKYDTKGY